MFALLAGMLLATAAVARPVHQIEEGKASKLSQAAFAKLIAAHANVLRQKETHKVRDFVGHINGGRLIDVIKSRRYFEQEKPKMMSREVSKNAVAAVAQFIKAREAANKKR